MFRSLLVRSRTKYAILLTATVMATLGAVASCASGKTSPPIMFGTPDSSTGSEGGFYGDAMMFGDSPGFHFPDSSTASDGGTDADAGCTSGCTDFPAPLNDPNGMIPGDPTALFPPDAGTPTTTGGPCLSEPANGALYPYNWLRPRVLWASTADQTDFEIRISAPGEVNDYVIYTTNHYWEMDQATWQKIAGVEGPGNPPGSLISKPITFTVTATSATGGNLTISNPAVIQIAPALADGSLIFWSTGSFATTSTSTDLQGFRVGDIGTTSALTVAQAAANGSGVWAQPPDGGNLPQPPILEPVGCIGCHTSTPDGNYVGFTAQWPWPNAIASVQADSGIPVGASPPWLTGGAIANLGPNTGDSNYLGGKNVTMTNNVDNVMLGIQTFSHAHYQTGDRIEITSVGASLDDPNDPNTGMPEGTQPACVGGTTPCVVSQLAWINLEWAGDADAGDRPSAATSAPSNGGWGILSRTGDTTNSAATPNWSYDGTNIAYTSVSQGTKDGRLDQPKPGTSADIKTIPYPFPTGTLPTPTGPSGTATSVPGASDPAYNEYFPAFSPDMALIAFNRVPAADTMYDQPLAEVYVVPYIPGSATTPAATCDGVATTNGACRLQANDPVQCTGLASPGVQNTWPKWAPNPIPPGAEAGAAPAPQTIGGNTYYWITFSSTRSITSGATPGANNPGKEQLYVAGVVVDSNGNISTFAPIYLWNQDDTVNNLIPAWGEFSIPPAPVPPIPPPIPPPPPPPPPPPR